MRGERGRNEFRGQDEYTVKFKSRSMSIHACQNNKRGKQQCVVETPPCSNFELRDTDADTDMANLIHTFPCSLL